MKDEYTYWLYYLDDELYAYTDNKKYAKKFESERDMELFKKVKKELSRQQVNYLADEFQSNYLKHEVLDTYDVDEDEYTKIDLVLTLNEFITITNMSVQIITVDLYRHCWLNPNYFNDELYDALKELGYVYCYKMISSSYENEEEPFKIDLLGLFLKYYGNTMKK